MSTLQDIERDAMLLDRAAVLQVVSALRCYRAAVQRALSLGYGDGTIDGATAYTLASSVKEIEAVDEDGVAELEGES